MQGLIGKKLGMTQVFDGDGHRVAVTVLEVGPCVVVQCKTGEKDGYEAVQLGFGEQKEHRVRKPLLARYKKVGATPCRHLKEFGLDGGDEIKEGDTLTASIFEGVSHVDVTGQTKGRGFQGGMKRHGMHGGRMTHGGQAKRKTGSIGQCSYPARVAKGKKMPGHMGNTSVTIQNLAIVEIKGDDNLLLVRGAIPGPTGAIVEVRKALKKAVKSA
jgi:large subunit ribosomal protein L3